VNFFVKFILLELDLFQSTLKLNFDLPKFSALTLGMLEVDAIVASFVCRLEPLFEALLDREICELGTVLQRGHDWRPGIVQQGVKGVNSLLDIIRRVAQL